MDINQLNSFIGLLKEKYPNERFFVDQEDVYFKVLSKNRDLINSEEFLDFFYNKSDELLLEDSYLVVPLYDYLNRMPEISFESFENIKVVFGDFIKSLSSKYLVKKDLFVQEKNENIVESKNIKRIVFSEEKFGQNKKLNYRKQKNIYHNNLNTKEDVLIGAEFVCEVA